MCQVCHSSIIETPRSTTCHEPESQDIEISNMDPNLVSTTTNFPSSPSSTYMMVSQSSILKKVDMFGVMCLDLPLSTYH